MTPYRRHLRLLRHLDGEQVESGAFEVGATLLILLQLVVWVRANTDPLLMADPSYVLHEPS